MAEDKEVYQKRDLILTEIHSDVKHLLKNFDSHVEEDKILAEKVQKRLEWQSKILYMGLGAVALIEFGARFFK